MMVPTGEHRIGDRFQPPLKKRKLRQPRVARACEFCRRRKVRCSGSLPCDYCVGEEADCTYNDQPGIAIDRQIGRQTSVIGISDARTHHAILPTNVAFQPEQRTHTSRDSSTVEPNSHGSRRPSLEPPQTFLEGHHIGPTAGVSFLFHAWNRGHDEPATEVGNGHSTLAPLISHGDFLPRRIADSGVDNLPGVDEAKGLLERYFRFATPTYRFLHRPSLESWTFQFLSGAQISAAKIACVLLACAQSLLYTGIGDRYAREDKDLEKSTMYYERAKKILDQEPGPPALASVQARLAMCLYLLSTFRINECRFCFSFTNEILTSIGLQRKSTISQNADLVDVESRKRTFWCSYILDGYLSVMLGRPRLLRDQDADQPYPRNIDDLDMLSAESLEDLPLHGNLEAFIWHAEIAKLMGRHSDLLYPLQSLSEQEVLTRSKEMIGALDQWRDDLPGFLKPRTKTLAGQRTFERQNTVLKLAQAHLRILVTRRCLLSDFNRLGRSGSNGSTKARDLGALHPVNECVAGMTTIITTTHDLVQSTSMYQAFWFTQYTALVAISTLYVFLIQGARGALPAPLTAFDGIEALFTKAKQCQQHLADIAPDGSQARRHHKLLDHLQARAEKDLHRRKGDFTGDSNLIETETRKHAPKTTTARHALLPSQLSQSGNNLPMPEITHDACQQQTQTDLARNPEGVENFSSLLQRPTHVDIDSGSLGPDEVSYTSIQFTPSDDEFLFQNILDLDWASFDTLGLPTHFDVL